MHYDQRLTVELVYRDVSVYANPDDEAQDDDNAVS